MSTNAPLSTARRRSSRARIGNWPDPMAGFIGNWPDPMAKSGLTARS
ncbi:hypothetical protein J2809_001300 [Arthrobacter pascens]|nr:hypothetical protein [Arthrobacter pascens]MDR6556949.1 hypothetical protein [Arthrobacter pascens]